MWWVRWPGVGPMLEAPLARGHHPAAAVSRAQHCQSIPYVMSPNHRWYLLAYFICCLVRRPSSIEPFPSCVRNFSCGCWKAAVAYADAMFEQWAWRKIIWSTATWRASPSGWISPRTRWVALHLRGTQTGAVAFVYLSAEWDADSRIIWQPSSVLRGTILWATSPVACWLTVIRTARLLFQMKYLAHSVYIVLQALV